MLAVNVGVFEFDTKYYLVQNLHKKTLYKVDTWMMMREDGLTLRIIITIINHIN